MLWAFEESCRILAEVFFFSRLLFSVVFWVIFILLEICFELLQVVLKVFRRFTPVFLVRALVISFFMQII